MEQKADYAKLRRLYFGTSGSATPSHLDQFNSESGSDDSQKTISSGVSEMITDTDDLNEMVFSSNETFSEKSTECMKKLHEKYGTQTYAKITKMINEEDFSEWEQLEKELLAVEIDPLMSNDDQTLSEGNIEAEADFDYLDALMQQDYKRLKNFDSECIGDIFSEIIENEQHSNSNYEDDVFNKNIELIFNTDVDLDSCEWEEFVEPEAIEPMRGISLTEKIDQLKQVNTFSVCEADDEMISPQIQPVSLNAFSSESAIASTPIVEEVFSSNKINRQRQLGLLNIYLLITGIIVLAILIYLMF